MAGLTGGRGAEGGRMKMLTRGKSETPPCSPWLCERQNADGEKAPTERRPPKWGLTDYAIGVCF